MKFKVGLCLISMLLVTTVAMAKNDAVSPDFRIVSNNKQFAAEVKAISQAPGKGKKSPEYVLTILESIPGQTKVVWSGPFKHGGYADGILSDDGTVFVYVNPWYKASQTVVTIYYKGKKTAEIRGKDFKIPGSKLRKGVSPKFWLSQKGEYFHFISVNNVSLALELITVDGKAHVIQTQNGKML